MIYLKCPEERYTTQPGNEEVDEVIPKLGHKEWAEKLATRKSKGKNSSRKDNANRSIRMGNVKGAGELQTSSVRRVGSTTQVVETFRQDSGLILNIRQSEYFSPIVIGYLLHMSQRGAQEE